MSLQVSVKPYRALQIVQEEARKNRSSRISWAQITKNKKYAYLISQNNLYSNHEEHLKRLKQAFRKAVKQIPVTMIDKNGESVPRYSYDAQKDEFVRRNEFQEIKNQDTLMKFVQKSPKGVIVSDQLLQYTYKDIQKDIDKLLSEKKIKKINSSNKTKKDYYIFTNTIQRQYELSDSYDHFGKEEYLELCKKNYKTFDDNEDDSIGASITTFSFSNQKFNQWVPGYTEMKKKWLLENQAKEKLKSRS